MTSVSLEVWKMDPWRSRRVRISLALTRLPLCAMARPPWAYSNTNGCALRSSELPLVE